MFQFKLPTFLLRSRKKMKTSYFQTLVEQENVSLLAKTKKVRSKKILVLVGVFSVGVIFGRVATFASSPLWLDSLNSNNTRDTNTSGMSLDNTRVVNVNTALTAADISIPFLGSTDNRSVSGNGSTDTINSVSAFYIVLCQQFVCTLVFGFVLLFTICVSPNYITDRERGYPKWRFLVIGFSMALSSLLVNSSTSGSKTPPYLQGILMNFSVPITFGIRFLILRKRPTMRKLLCAGVVVITEFICMIPTIFPSLESKEARQTDGGAEGAARILWPLVFVSSQVPYAIQSTVIEKVTKDQKSENGTETARKSPIPETDQINMVYFLFWSSAFTFLSALLLFWTQLIPGFSDVTNLSQFGEQIWFNIQCEFAASPCSGYVSLVSSINILANLLAVFSIANLLRWSEGANYLMVVSTIRTPLLFLFWTLFQEQPFRWFPHASLGTWLSIGAIFIMLPAVYAYSTGPPEHDPSQKEMEVTVGNNVLDEESVGISSDLTANEDSYGIQ